MSSKHKKTACSKEVLHAVLSLYINVKHGEKAFEGVLTVKTGIYQIALFILPFGKAAVVKRLFSIFYDERYDAIVQACAFTFGGQPLRIVRFLRDRNR